MKKSTNKTVGQASRLSSTHRALIIIFLLAFVLAALPVWAQSPYEGVPKAGVSGKVCKTITNPSDVDNFLFDIASARTVKKLWGICIGGTSVVVTLQDAGATGSGSTTIATLTATTTGASTTTIPSATLHNGDIVKIDIGVVTGAVTQVMVCYE